MRHAGAGRAQNTDFGHAMPSAEGSTERALELSRSGDMHPAEACVCYKLLSILLVKFTQHRKLSLMYREANLFLDRIVETMVTSHQ